jgi:hypothetical protein
VEAARLLRYLEGRKSFKMTDNEIVEQVLKNIGAPPDSSTAYWKAGLLEAIRITRLDCALALAKNRDGSPPKRKDQKEGQ